MNNYTEAAERLGTRESRKVANNTYLKRRGPEAVALMLHATDVVTYHKDGRVVLSSGGWRTATTKDRIHANAPARLSQRGGVWYVYYFGTEYAFSDGMTLFPNGVVMGASEVKEPAKAARAEVKAIKAYCAEYMRRFMAGEMEKPGGGDCWYCLMKTADGRTLGESSGNEDHIRQHVKEGYYVPSMLPRAAEVFGVSQVARSMFAYVWGDTGEKAPDFVRGIAAGQLGRALYRFVKRGYGLAA